MNWCRVPVRNENKSNAEEELILHISQRYLFVDDELSPSIGLTFSRIDNSLPFIRMPRQQSLNIIGQNGMEKIMNAFGVDDGTRYPLQLYQWDAHNKNANGSLKRGDHRTTVGSYDIGSYPT